MEYYEILLLIFCWTHVQELKEMQTSISGQLENIEGSMTHRDAVRFSVNRLTFTFSDSSLAFAKF